MAIKDEEGHCAVIPTAELRGFQAAIVTNTASKRTTSETGLERTQSLFNSLYSDTGPLVSLDPWLDANAAAHAPLSPENREEAIA